MSCNIIIFKSIERDNILLKNPLYIRYKIEYIPGKRLKYVGSFFRSHATLIVKFHWDCWFSQTLYEDVDTSGLFNLCLTCLEWFNLYHLHYYLYIITTRKIAKKLVVRRYKQESRVGLRSEKIKSLGHKWEYFIDFCLLFGKRNGIFI